MIAMSLSSWASLTRKFEYACMSRATCVAEVFQVNCSSCCCLDDMVRCQKVVELCFPFSKTAVNTLESVKLVTSPLHDFLSR